MSKGAIAFVCLVMLGLQASFYFEETRPMRLVSNNRAAVKCWINQNYIDVSDAVKRFSPDSGWELDVVVTENNSNEFIKTVFIKNCYLIPIDDQKNLGVKQ